MLKVIHKSLYESSLLYSTGSELRLNLQEQLLLDCPLTLSAKSGVKSHWNKTRHFSSPVSCELGMMRLFMRFVEVLTV